MQVFKSTIQFDCSSHGAWLSFGNVDLHLIKGRPAVHLDDDLIVSHIALTVKDMDKLRKRLYDMGVVSRKIITVPNPELKTSVDQVSIGTITLNLLSSKSNLKMTISSKC